MVVGNGVARELSERCLAVGAWERGGGWRLAASVRVTGGSRVERVACCSAHHVQQDDVEGGGDAIKRIGIR